MTVIGIVSLLLEIFWSLYEMTPDQRVGAAKRLSEAARKYEETGDTSDLGRID